MMTEKEIEDAAREYADTIEKHICAHRSGIIQGFIEATKRALSMSGVSGSLPTDTEIQEWAKKEAARWEKDKAKAVAYASHLIDGALWMRSMLVGNNR